MQSVLNTAELNLRAGKRNGEIIAGGVIPAVALIVEIRPAVRAVLSGAHIVELVASTSDEGVIDDRGVFSRIDKAVHNKLAGIGSHVHLSICDSRGNKLRPVPKSSRAVFWRESHSSLPIFAASNANSCPPDKLWSGS